MNPVAGGMAPATGLRPNSTGGAEVVVEVDLELPGLGGQVTEQESHILVPEKQEAHPHQLGRNVLGEEALQVALSPPGTAAGPFGLGCNSKCGCLGAPAKGKGSGREGRGEGSPREAGVSLGNVKAVENLFPSGTTNGEEKFLRGSSSCEHDFQTQGLEKNHLGHTM